MIDQREYNRKLIEEFRAARGSTEGPFPGRPLLLLTTSGAKTARQIPLVALYRKQS